MTKQPLLLLSFFAFIFFLIFGSGFVVVNNAVNQETCHDYTTFEHKYDYNFRTSIFGILTCKPLDVAIDQIIFLASVDPVNRCRVLLSSKLGETAIEEMIAFQGWSYDFDEHSCTIPEPN